MHQGIAPPDLLASLNHNLFQLGFMSKRKGITSPLEFVRILQHVAGMTLVCAAFRTLCVSAPRVSRTVMSRSRPEGQGPVAMPATPSHDEVDGDDGGSWKLEG